MTGVQDTADRSTMKLCLNCHTENPVDEVFCAECGMSLVKAPTGEEAVKAREEMERARSVALAAQPAQGQWMRRIARILALVWAGYWTVLIGVAAYVIGQLLSGVTYFGSRPYQPAWQSTGSMCLPLSPVLVIVWVSALIPWRWQRAGGAVLVAGGLLLLLPLTLFVRGPLSGFDRILVPIPVFSGLVSLAAGILFLVSWRKSRTPAAA